MNIQDLEPEVRDNIICPITFDIMTDPVMDPEGNTYEREAIEKFRRSGEVA